MSQRSNIIELKDAHKHTRFSYELREYEKQSLLMLWDETEAPDAPSLAYMSLTNAAEFVLPYLCKTIGAIPELVIYKDTDNNWDRIYSTPEGKIERFAPILTGRSNRNYDDTNVAQIALAAFLDEAHPVVQ